MMPGLQHMYRRHMQLKRAQLSVAEEASWARALELPGWVSRPMLWASRPWPQLYPAPPACPCPAQFDALASCKRRWLLLGTWQTSSSCAGAADVRDLLSGLQGLLLCPLLGDERQHGLGGVGHPALMRQAQAQAPGRNQQRLGPAVVLLPSASSGVSPGQRRPAQACAPTGWAGTAGATHLSRPAA